MNTKQKDYHRLYMSELVTALVVGSLLYMTSHSRGMGLDLRLFLPGGILLFIILQSAGYWYYRHQQVITPGGDYHWIIPTFSFLKRINLVVLAIYPLYLLLMLMFYRPALWSAINVFGIILYGFSILEYFNYYYFSLQVHNLKKREPTELALEIQAYQQDQ
ncbi:hypothetical protein Q5O24_00510 [Eubacteriaceae bacterium ES3]|nr:hypothetical protein Q5O24_00510 [Eubacteriaceae bacterium ES3]